MSTQTGAQLMVQCLNQLGVRDTWGMCGHGNLALLDALLDSKIRFVSVFHEQIAAHAADAYFRVSGKPGVVITTVGPGLTNTVTAILDAQMDASAVVVIAGDVPIDYVGRGAMQELQLHDDASQAQIFRSFTKRVFRPLKVDQIPDCLVRAFATATSGCPGPVLVSVPLDLFSAFTDKHAGDLTRRLHTGHKVRADQSDVVRAANLLATAQRPLIFAGGGAILSGATRELVELAEQLSIPVATSMSGQGAIPEDHPLAAGFTGVVGTPVANRLAREADVVLAVGTRFAEMDASSWRREHFFQIPPARLIHVDIQASEIGKIYETEFGLVGDAAATVAELVAHVRTIKKPAADSNWVRQMQKECRSWAQELRGIELTSETVMEPARVLHEVRKVLPRDGILISGVGIRHIVGQHFPIYTPRSLIVGSGYATMGQEVPAPLGAKLARPELPVVAVVGDGAFHSLPSSVAVAVANHIPVIWVVLNNGGYASIAIYQAKHFGRYQATYFEDHSGQTYQPDTVGVALSYGALAERVETPEDFAAALHRAMASGRPCVIEVVVTDRPRVRTSGHWAVNDIMGVGVEKELSPERV